ncbi:hypothetical protein V5P93_003648 [Actinokineospora auranticolor]|uniref:Activator of Hsp90 ATPase-like protein n=1 Tax=Actinokineospora auranticolor TaxID=155976 RepID=A0A2S6GJ80_9PSEU|nr:hypothetical protein [Actinokineospora auranticolor]PPK65211.1 hypothetical protein CLV40_11558 [Actinokineospora auranticolor]
MSETPRIVVTVAATADATWRALRDKDVIGQWHGWDTADLDAEIDAIYFTGVTEDAETRTLVAHGGDRFQVHETEGGARVTLTRAPLSGDPNWDAYYDQITEGWTTFLHQLRFTLERRPTARRRTVFRNDNASAVERLGLDSLTGPPGSRYRATLAGERVEGEVWFRTERQLGLTVDSWGEGLLVVEGIGADPTAVLSTYDLDGAAFDALDTRWAAWWSESEAEPR